MKKYKLGFWVLTGLLSCSMLAGCGSSTGGATVADVAVQEKEASTEGKKEELVFVNYRDIRDLNPHLYAGEMYAQEMLYETLVNITADGYEGCLAHWG